MEPRKYPRTVHFPWSLTVQSDDRVSADFVFDADTEVIVTEKMDGENTTFYTDRFHARSIDGRSHPSRSMVASIHAGISYLIPENRRIVLENVYAQHSIRYDDLEAFAYGIMIADTDSESGESTVLSWDDTTAVFDELGLISVPVLYRGPFDEKVIRKIFEGLDFSKQEGVVVRTAGAFPEADFQRNVGKAVRADHVQSDKHWTHSWKPNALAQ